MRKIALFSTIIMVAAALSATPKLTVVVLADGLTGDNLTQLQPYLQQGGLRTLAEEGYRTSLTFPHIVFGGDETTATLLSGRTPFEHGYAMDSVFDTRTRKAIPLLRDNNVTGIGTAIHISPEALMSPTLADRLRLKHMDAKIYAVGLRASTTVLMAGHCATACCWLDPVQQQWVSTGYYSYGLPAAADAFNRSGRIAELAAKAWTPRMAVSTYLQPTDKERKSSFSYLPASNLLLTPAANTLVIELALAIQQKEALGKDNIPDMLLLQLNTLTPGANSDDIESAEQEDMYLCLNQDLGYLMDQLDRRIGRENYQLLVLGLPRKGVGAAKRDALHLSQQNFNIDKASALLNTYLMALYGHERWVDGAYGTTIYLNRKLIEQKKMDLTALQRQAANFMLEFEGVKFAYTQTDLMNQPAMLSSYNKRNMGDVVVTLYNQWQDPQALLLYRSDSRRIYPDKMDIYDLKQLLQL